MKKLLLKFLACMAATMFVFLLKMPVQASDATAFAPIFNADYYAQANADLKAALGIDDALLFQHFLTSGMAEGRLGSAEFNVHTYRANNPDLLPVLGEDLTAYYLHYLNCGKAEGRIANTASDALSNPNSISTENTIETPQFPIIVADYPYNDSNCYNRSHRPTRPSYHSESAEYFYNGTPAIWTASNGVKAYVELDAKNPAQFTSRIFFCDTPLNFRPHLRTPELEAYVEFHSLRENGIKPEVFFLKPENIPLVELATEVPGTKVYSNPSWEKFVKAYAPIVAQQTDFSEEYITSQLTIDPAGEDSFGIDIPHSWYQKYFAIEYDEYLGWRLQIFYNMNEGANYMPTELMWYGIRNCLRLITPDAELIFPAIYEHFYGGNHPFPNNATSFTFGDTEVIATRGSWLARYSIR